MTEGLPQLSFSARIRLRWNLLLRSILNLWTKAQVIGEDEVPALDGPRQAVCYVLADYALSSVLILDRVCEDLGRSRPLLPVRNLETQETRAYAALRRMTGLLVRRPSTRRSSEVLKRLVARTHAEPDLDVVLVPVTVLVGRAPDKETGITKVLFTEDWEIGGRLRRFLSTLINGRDTVVQFSEPISLRALADENLGEDRALRKVSRILRTHLRRVKASVIGPDLSHRRTVVDTVIGSAAVKEAIADKARRDGIDLEQAQRIAEKYAMEIAANYSYSFVRIGYFVLSWVFRRIYRGVSVHHFEQFKRRALDHEIIYVPCHRSHADYILLSYLLYTHGFVPPHIAAGINLNLPVVGAMVRMGGAFYLRRTFKSQKLYSAVFYEYLSTIIAQGVSIEYFIEGTRSRTGRLLSPKGGMLAMTVRAYLRNPERPVMFQPVYLGYEQLLEGAAYTAELSGATKKKETLLDLFRSMRILGRNFGQAHVSFGEPILLDEMLEATDPEWRVVTADPEARPNWVTPLTNELGDRILRHINACADVNPVNLLASVLLAAPKHALGYRELLLQLELYKQLVSQGPLSERVTVTPLEPAGIVSYGFELGLLSRKEHPLGDVITVAAQKAVNLTYFRNNAAHLFAIPSLAAACFLRRRNLEATHMQRVAADVYPFLRAELYLPWSEEQFPGVLAAYLDLLQSLGLLEREAEGVLARAMGGTDAAARMNLLARNLLPTLERYYITIAVLAKNGSGALSRQQLERLCIMTAQRISMLQEFEAPEFYDRNLFQQFINELRKRNYLVSDGDGELVFGERLAEMGEDARFFLEKEIRHGIIQVAPQVLAGPVQATGSE